MVKYKQDLDKTFGALADGTRRAVLYRLSASPCPISELASEHAMTLAGMLKHVRVLEEAGLVRSVKKSRTRVCEMQPDSCDPAIEWLENYRRRWDMRFESLAAYLEEMKD